jgi:hypothetical protein
MRPTDRNSWFVDGQPVRMHAARRVLGHVRSEGGPGLRDYRCYVVWDDAGNTTLERTEVLDRMRGGNILAQRMPRAVNDVIANHMSF